MSAEIVRPTKVWAYIKEKGIRVSADAKPKIIQMLNIEVAKEIDNIIDKLPKFSKGQKKGEIKRKTIKPEDLG